MQLALTPFGQLFVWTGIVPAQEADCDQTVGRVAIAGLWARPLVLRIACKRAVLAVRTLLPGVKAGVAAQVTATVPG